jgi:hypothetical protein
MKMTDGAWRAAARICLNTTLSPAASILTCLALEKWQRGIYDASTAMNAVVAGLVGITGPCGVVEPWAAIVVGAISGLVYCLSWREYRISSHPSIQAAATAHANLCFVFIRPRHHVNREMINLAYSLGFLRSARAAQDRRSRACHCGTCVAWHVGMHSAWAVCLHQTRGKCRAATSHRVIGA